MLGVDARNLPISCASIISTAHRNRMEAFTSARSNPSGGIFGLRGQFGFRHAQFIGQDRCSGAERRESDTCAQPRRVVRGGIPIRRTCSVMRAPSSRYRMAVVSRVPSRTSSSRHLRHLPGR